MGYFYTELSGEVDPTTGNVDLSLHPQIPKEFSKHFFSVTCFIDKTKTEPVHHEHTDTSKQITAGIVTIEASDDGVNFGSIKEGNVDLSAAFNRPNLEGRIKTVRAEVKGLTPTTVSPITTGIFVVIGIHSYC